MTTRTRHCVRCRSSWSYDSFRMIARWRIAAEKRRRLVEQIKKELKEQE